MFETFFEKGRVGYLIELVYVATSPGGFVTLKSDFETEDDGMTPRVFKTKHEAEEWVTHLLNGQTTTDIRAYSIRKFRMTTPKRPISL